MSFIDFFKSKKKKSPQEEKEVTKELTMEYLQDLFSRGGGIVLYHEGLRSYGGTGFKVMVMRNDESYFVREEDWWPAGAGSTNAGCIDIPLEDDYFGTHTVDEFIELLSSSKLKGNFDNIGEVEALRVIFDYYSKKEAEVEAPEESADENLE